MMLGVDTNVLVRFLVRDDEAQFEKARKIIRREIDSEEYVFVSLMVVLEAEWVLRRLYKQSKNEILEVISGLLESIDVQFEDEPAIEESLLVWKGSAADFADCLIGAHNRRMPCRATATFDAKALKLPAFIAL
jgi:predicted nucleic-acid-binding protein